MRYGNIEKIIGASFVRCDTVEETIGAQSKMCHYSTHNCNFPVEISEIDQHNPNVLEAKFII